MVIYEEFIYDPSKDEWMDNGNCSRLNLDMFPSDAAQAKAAKQVCNFCDVRVECLEHALIYRIEHGVWGGTSERERMRIQKSRRTTA